jgi:hypothetical protein
VSAKGGSGGGCFRYMLGRFLSEAAGLGAPAALLPLASAFKSIGDAWEEAAELCRAASEGSGMDAAAAEAALPELSRLLGGIAGLEEKAWSGLARAVAPA